MSSNHQNTDRHRALLERLHLDASRGTLPPRLMDTLTAGLARLDQASPRR